MNKIWTITKREYLIRVRKKSFLILTILVPLIFALFSIGIGALSVAMAEKPNGKIIIKDDSGVFAKYIANKSSNFYSFSDEDITKLKKTYKDKGFDWILYIPKNTKNENIKVQYFGDKKMGLMTRSKIQSDIANAFKEFKKKELNISPEIFKQLDVKVNLINGNFSENEDKKEKLSMGIATTLSFVMGFLLYMVIFVFGTQVMRSIMEEKINRIVEVIISSVKPFELMLGKIIGVGAVGLTQLLIWLTLIPVVLSLSGNFYKQKIQNSQVSIPKIDGHEFTQIIDVFFSMNWAMILPFFILFFLGGYFLYASMFAAIGSAVGDDMTDVQSLTTIITLPVIAGFVIMMNTVNNPDSTLAIMASIFPLTSPIVMVSRLPFNPPLWQVLLSLVLLIFSIIFIVWISAKIYRGGILMYGKKLTYKDMWKILRNK